MKRRSFTFGLAALASAPAIPVTALAQAQTGITAQQFSLAKLLARSHNHCTVDMLARHMKITPELATHVQSALLKSGVITQPVAGVSMATSPTNTHCITRDAIKPTNLGKLSREVGQKLRKAVEDLTTPESSTDLQQTSDNATQIELDEQADAAALDPATTQAAEAEPDSKKTQRKL